jgi:hypothetical protein
MLLLHSVSWGILIDRKRFHSLAPVIFVGEIGIPIIPVISNGVACEIVKHRMGHIKSPSKDLLIERDEASLYASIPTFAAIMKMIG